jgi:hypothetical protein
VFRLSIVAASATDLSANGKQTVNELSGVEAPCVHARCLDESRKLTAFFHNVVSCISLKNFDEFIAFCNPDCGLIDCLPSSPRLLDCRR